MRRQSGFTLVELAIVVTIVGLLIGGIIKGQDIVDNVRVTRAGMMVKTVDTAVSIFRSTYRDLPGDMPRAGSRLLNCTTSPCNVSGNGNNFIGYTYGASNNTPYTPTQEQNTFWWHLKVAGLLDLPPADAAGAIYLDHGMATGRGYIQVQGWPYSDNMDSVHWYYMYGNGTTSSPLAGIPMNVLGRYDLKFDDGHPNAGNIRMNTYCGTAMNSASTSYDPNEKTPCLQQVRARF